MGGAQRRWWMLLLMGCLVGSARAQTTTAIPSSITLNAGTLTMTTVGRFVLPTTTLTGNGLVITPSKVPTLTVRDARGATSGAGWNLLFKLTGNFISGANTIAGTNLTMSTGAGTVTPSTTSDPAPNAETGLSGNLSSTGVGVKAVSASSGAGRGKYVYALAPAEFSLAIPNNAVVGTYSATLQLTLSSGP